MDPNKNPEQKTFDVKDLEYQQNHRNLEVKIDKIYISVEKTRKYLLWTFIITVVVLILPIIGLLFAIPVFLSQLSAISSLGL